MTPRLLIYDQPANGLEAKFSMPFCAAAAIVYGQVGINTFDSEHIQALPMQALMPKVSMRVHAAFDVEAPLSHTRVTIRLRSGRVVTEAARGARGYPALPASEEQLAAKFAECASRSLAPPAADRAWSTLAGIGTLVDLSALADLLVPSVPTSVS